MDLLERQAYSQYIDDNGKTRMITYRSDSGYVCLMVSPIPPLDLPVERTIRECSASEALRFIRERDLDIVYQDGNSVEIKGLWVAVPELYYAYIPIIYSDPLTITNKEGEEVGFAPEDRSDPLRTEAQSDLQEFRRKKKIAHFLQQYTLYLYSHDPESFGKESFIVIPDHRYQIEKLNKRLFIEGNEVMFREGRLIVLSKEIRDRLMAYLQVQLLNDRPGVLAMRETSTITHYYQSIADFRPCKNQLIFMDLEGLRRWKEEQKITRFLSQVSATPREDLMTPYFYRNPRVENGNLVMIQNVKGGDKKAAIYLSHYWMENRVNLGPNTTPSSTSKISFIAYNEGGEIETFRSKSSLPVPIFQYDSGDYAAMMFFS